MIVEALERELPPATLLLGPELGKLYGATYKAVRGRGVLIADIFGALHLSAADARNAVKFSQIASFGEQGKVVIAGLDGASTQAQNILLKVLEEPLPMVRFILVATSRPLPTIMSRCHVIAVPGETGPPETDRKVTAQVTAALNAANAGDLRGLDAALSGWGDAQQAALTNRAADAAIAGQLEARRLLGALGRFEGAQPRLAAHAALITVICDKEHHD